MANDITANEINSKISAVNAKRRIMIVLLILRILHHPLQIPILRIFLSLQVRL